MSLLLQNQHRFVLMVARLIAVADGLGYQLSFGEAWRPKGASWSFHTSRLAIDLNLFKDGKYLSETEDHRELGEVWERMGGTWGGRFSKPDGNHYSLGE